MPRHQHFLFYYFAQMDTLLYLCHVKTIGAKKEPSNHLVMKKQEQTFTKHTAATLGTIVLLLFSMMSFSKDKCTLPPTVDEHSYIPLSPDYADSTMWIVEDNDTTDTGADVFYVVSTWEEDWTTPDGDTCHYADVWNSTHRQNMAKEMHKAASYMAPGNRFFAPYYRHMTIDGWMTKDEDIIYRRTRLSMNDVCQAFDHFLQWREQSQDGRQGAQHQARPLIIAGFSQGGLAVVELLKHMTDETYQQLAAAYVLGYKVTEADTLACHHIRPAQSAEDTGVTICYNTVKDAKYILPVIAGSCIAINPVNWRTDATPATLHDTITVTLSPRHHVLVVTGYSGDEYPPYKGFLNVGDIHSCEPWLYSDCLKENMRHRADNWRKTHR